jgi:hypothetical protein
MTHDTHGSLSTMTTFGRTLAIGNVGRVVTTMGCNGAHVKRADTIRRSASDMWDASTNIDEGEAHVGVFQSIAKYHSISPGSGMKGISGTLTARGWFPHDLCDI